jgi:FkbM family methyltransferase
MSLKALFYPDVPFEQTFIPYIYKEVYFDGLYVDVLNQKKDMVIIDVGANIGIITDVMRPYAKKIYAIEPATEHFEALKKNKEYNHWDNVEIFKMAMSNKDGEGKLSLNLKNRTCHSMINDWRFGKTEKVKMIRFDTFMKENKIKEVDFVKFDVEGAEDMILRSEGFINIAKKIKAIEVEFHFKTFPDLIKHMESLGFSGRRYDSSSIVVLFTRT